METEVPFLQTSIYLRSAGVIAASYNYSVHPFWTYFSQWFVRKFAPAVPQDAFTKLDSQAEFAVAAIASALEEHDISRVRYLLEPSLYSLFLDNYLRLTRIKNYRLAVSGIRCKRVAMKTTIRLPAFAKETSSAVALWPGINFIYSQPADHRPLMAARKLMVQTVGTNYAQLKQQQMIAETPLEGSLINSKMIDADDDAVSMDMEATQTKDALQKGYNPFDDFPMPERLLSPTSMKKRLIAYSASPLIGDFVSFVKYLRAMRRAGFDYVLKNARVEYEVVYGCEATHSVSVVPMAEPPPEPEQYKDTRTKEEEMKKRLEELSANANFEDRAAPHLLVFRGSFPLHRDSIEHGDRSEFTGWRISEFDGLRYTENHTFGKLAKLSSKSVEEIDKVLPALRVFSKDLFTPLGPKQEWFEEVKRLIRVARNRRETSSLNDPLEELANLRGELRAGNNVGKSPVEIMLAHANDMIPNQKPSPSNNGRPTTMPPTQSSSKPLGNIFDLAKDHKDPPLRL